MAYSNQPKPNIEKLAALINREEDPLKAASYLLALCKPSPDGLEHTAEERQILIR